MRYCDEGMDFERALTDERPHLVRLCAWFAGSEEAAEDLAQETLIAAWHSRHQLISADKLKPWTSAIARNICLNWLRGHYREQAHLLASMDASDETFEDKLQDETSLEYDLDRHELATLLDRALALLPAETSQLLIDHYIKEVPHAEIAERMRINPGTVAVRLQRGKLTLKRLLQTKLQAESSAFGLVEMGGPQWQETNIWCPCCGRTHLLGRFQKNEIFALRCPSCHSEPGTIMAGLDLTKPYHANLLGNTRMYKPAYARLLTSFAPLYQQALQSHTAPCLACGLQVDVSVDHEVNAQSHRNKETIRILLHCPACGWASSKALSGLVLALPEAQQFWREYPRLRMLPAQEIEAQGSRAFVTRLQSMTGTAELAVISQRDTFELLEVHSNIKL
jgi:RNA polymerase sigma factor (sigma-70 family)